MKKIIFIAASFAVARTERHPVLACIRSHKRPRPPPTSIEVRAMRGAEPMIRHDGYTSDLGAIGRRPSSSLRGPQGDPRARRDRARVEHRSRRHLLPREARGLGTGSIRDGGQPRRPVLGGHRPCERRRLLRQRVARQPDDRDCRPPQAAEDHSRASRQEKALLALHGNFRTHRRLTARNRRAETRPDWNPDGEGAHAVSDGVTGGLIGWNGADALLDNLRIAVVAGEMHRPSGCRGGGDERGDEGGGEVSRPREDENAHTNMADLSKVTFAPEPR